SSRNSARRRAARPRRRRSHFNLTDSSSMSLNDPNWGRGSRGPDGSRGGPGGGNQGPPDLDELWRNFNRRLAELFGRRRRGGDEPPRPPSSWQVGGGASLLV